MYKESRGILWESTLLRKVVTGELDFHSSQWAFELDPNFYHYCRSIAIYRLAKDSHGNLVIGSCIKKHYKLDRSKYQTCATENNHTEDSATGSTAHTGQTFRLFQDENLVSFFRRLSFTNDGALLVTPAGVYKQTSDDNDMDTDDASNHGDSTSKNETQNTIYVYARNSITQYVENAHKSGQGEYIHKLYWRLIFFTM